MINAYARLIEALDAIELKLEKSGETPLSELEDFLDRLGVLCARAKGAALLLECKDNERMDQTPRA